MKPTQLTYIICFLFLITSCKNDPKSEPETQTTTETEQVVEQTTTKRPKKETYEMRKVRLELTPLNNAAVDIKSVFSDQAGSVAVMGSINGAPNTVYTAEIMEFKSSNTSDFTKTNLKKWSTNSGKFDPVSTDDNGRAIINYKTSDWCLGCDDDNRNIKGKVLVISEGENSNTTYVAASVIN